VGDRSAIEWTEATWNPVTGCDKVSPGCAHCYAERFAERWRGIRGHPYEQGFELRLWPDRLDIPLRWRRSRVVFVDSMSDLFHERIPEEFVARVFKTMVSAPQHAFQILTKRHERLAELAPALPWPDNVWMGVTIENRRFVNRADYLRDVPAAVRFISAEPLLGRLEGLDLTGIDWLIASGESGPRHRPVRGGVAARAPRPLPGRGCRLLLQAVGGRARNRADGRCRAHLGRDAKRSIAALV
jgi:protein gp37